MMDGAGSRELGAQFTIFDYIDSPEEIRVEELRAEYMRRGYRPRIAEALARKQLGLENPDAFLLAKFNITGEDLTK